jgi:L-lactate utilization protein LutC
MNRSAFLENLARAAAAGRREAAANEAGPVVPRGKPLSRAELIDRFASELAAVVGIFHAAADEQAVAGIVKEIIANEPDGPVLADEAMAHLLADTDREVVVYKEGTGLIPRAAACAVGVGRTVAAVAETGSIVVTARDGRGVSLLPPCQVSVLRARDIYLTVGDCLAALARAGWDSLGSGLVFITGPSKTGDIESHMVLGVHGPGRTHVIVIRGDERGQG